MSNNIADDGEVYRLYKMLNATWEKTSYVGNKETLFKIWRSLCQSNIYLFDVRKEDIDKEKNNLNILRGKYVRRISY